MRSDLYSPPRVTQVVSEIGLRAAWFLDLTTVDPVHGQPWDFGVEVKQKRAVELLERDKPLLFQRLTEPHLRQAEQE